MEDNILRFVNLKWCRATKFKYGLWAQNGLEWTFNTDDMTMSWKTTYKMDIERPQIGLQKSKTMETSPHLLMLLNSTTVKSKTHLQTIRGVIMMPIV